MTDATKAASDMREAAAKVAETEFMSKELRTKIAAAIRALSLPAPAASVTPTGTDFTKAGARQARAALRFPPDPRDEALQREKFLDTVIPGSAMGVTVRTLTNALEASEKDIVSRDEALRLAREALRRVARWTGEFPPTGQHWPSGSPMSYAACFGSNGERDFMREVARAALAAIEATMKGSRR